MPAAEGSRSLASRLYVGSLAFETSDATLGEFFSRIGEVESATVMKDRDTGLGRGFGFVVMANEAGEAKALELNGQVLDGRQIVVDRARERR